MQSAFSSLTHSSAHFTVAMSAHSCAGIKSLKVGSDFLFLFNFVFMFHGLVARRAKGERRRTASGRSHPFPCALGSVHGEVRAGWRQTSWRGSWPNGRSEWDSGTSTRGLSEGMVGMWWSAVMLLGVSVISLSSGSSSVRRGKNNSVRGVGRGITENCVHRQRVCQGLDQGWFTGGNAEGSRMTNSER